MIALVRLVFGVKYTQEASINGGIVCQFNKSAFAERLNLLVEKYVSFFPKHRTIKPNSASSFVFSFCTNQVLGHHSMCC